MKDHQVREGYHAPKHTPAPNTPPAAPMGSAVPPLKDRKATPREMGCDYYDCLDGKPCTVCGTKGHSSVVLGDEKSDLIRRIPELAGGCFEDRVAEIKRGDVSDFSLLRLAARYAFEFIGFIGEQIPALDGENADAVAKIAEQQREIDRLTNTNAVLKMAATVAGEHGPGKCAPLHGPGICDCHTSPGGMAFPKKGDKS